MIAILDEFNACSCREECRNNLRELARLKRERDKALSDVALYRDIANDVMNARDEARALLKDMLNHIDGGELRNTIMWTTLFQAQIRKLLAGDRQGDAHPSTPEAGHHKKMLGPS